jgi:hypothetical protein
MNSRVLGFLLVGASVMLAANKADKPAPGTDAAVAEQVRHEVVMYPRYTIWDDVSFRVTQGQVELIGAVSQPYKKDDIERLVRNVPGVTGIRDEIKVLPLSDQDDRLRQQVARAIYRDPVFTRYALQAHPPIHIIVQEELSARQNPTFPRRLAQAGRLCRFSRCYNLCSCFDFPLSRRRAPCFYRVAIDCRKAFLRRCNGRHWKLPRDSPILSP